MPDVSELSADDKRTLLQTALIADYEVTPPIPEKPDDIWVSEVFDDYLIYSIELHYHN